ncbi:MAG: T9SS type A sorting domain-containing protein [Flavobacteriales bacterium]
MSTQTLFSSLQGGDYHVYPDGSILMSGAHSLYDTARGYVGIYNLIWFTNTGHLDTTKTHRYCNGVIYEIEQQPDGKFLCSGTCSTYEGQPVRRVFRVHADGALDTSFDPEVAWGRVSEFLVLEDTRIVVVGRFGLDDLPGDTIRMARLLGNGELDTSFDQTITFGLGTIPNYLDLGVIPNSIDHWPGGRYLVTGTFQQVNGEPRFGLCVVDSTGTLMPEFSGAGVGTYVYQGQVLGGVSGVHFTPDNMLYVYGTFHGYTDGTTNDPDQRFITRLYGPDLTTAVSDAPKPVQASVRVAPNPTHGHFTLFLPADLGPAQARLLDASGRVVQHYTLPSGAEQQPLSTAAEAGTYLLLVEARDGQRWQARVVVE